MASRSRDTAVPPGAGQPRLVKATDGHAVVGSPEASGIEQSFRLDREVTRLGGADDQDIVVPGVDPEHGEIRREPELDEYVYHQTSPSGTSQVNGAIVDAAALHHGDRLTLGEWTLVFQRDEFAEHGRFEGGRQGGDASGPLGAGSGGDEQEPGTADSSDLQ
jgi:hypothetical protein